LKNEAPRYVQMLPELPRLIHQALRSRQGNDRAALEALLLEQQRSNRLLRAVVVMLALSIALGLAGAVLAWLLSGLSGQP